VKAWRACGSARYGRVAGEDMSELIRRRPLRIAGPHRRHRLLH
jgi:hypothetical protein